MLAHGFLSPFLCYSVAVSLLVPPFISSWTQRYVLLFSES